MTPSVTVASVVEGHGEVSALPVLVRRIANEIFGRYDVELLPPHRLKRSQMIAGDLVCRAAMLQAGRVSDQGGVLVVADADDKCAVSLAEDLRQLAKPTVVEVAVAVREFEAWFLAAIESLRTHRAVRHDALFTGQPEAPRGAKELLSTNMKESYKETLHQPAFAAIMDLALARRARSFEHLVGCVGRLVQQ
jgi:hypothetical protein